MQCGVKRKRCPSTEFDIEKQQSLFDTSVMKLHQEHMRHGMEPRLVRFVLINNALKLLQMHMLRLEEEDALGSLDYDGASNRFFSNTFKHGLPSPAPLSPLASSSKSLKLEQNELMAATPFQSGEESVDEEEGTRPGSVVSEERRPSNGLATVNSLATVNQSCTETHLGKRSIEEDASQESQAPPSKKACQDHDQSSETTTGLSTVILDLSLESSSSNGHLDLTPSEDFAKVDPAMYDYDVPSGPTEPPSSRPCTMQAIGTPVVQNGGPDSCVEGGEGSESSSDPSVESDFLDELDHIVNLLMT